MLDLVWPFCIILPSIFILQTAFFNLIKWSRPVQVWLHLPIEIKMWEFLHQKSSASGLPDHCLIVLARVVFFDVANPTHLAGLTQILKIIIKLFGLCFQASVGKREGERHLDSEMIPPSPLQESLAPLLVWQVLICYLLKHNGKQMTRWCISTHVRPAKTQTAVASRAIGVIT